MRRQLGRWLAETRSGRAVFLTVTVAGVLGAAYMVIRSEVGRQTREITERVTVIEEVSPYDVVRACLRSPSCRSLFEHPERAHPDRRERGDVLQPSTGEQQPRPRRGGDSVGEGVGKGGRRAPGPRDTPSAAPNDLAPAPVAPASPPQPGSTPNPVPPSPPKSLPEQAADSAKGAAEGVEQKADGVPAAVCGVVALPTCDR
jgi:hypothetical protein